MTADLISLLDRNGYAIYRTKEYFIVRKQVFSSWWLLLLFLSIGLIFFAAGTMILLGTGGAKLSMSVFFLAIGVVLLVAPFFNYLTAAYRSLVIDLHHQTILFRAGYSRAYLFTEVKDIKLEVHAKQAGTDPFSKSNKEFHYTITAYMERGHQEELLVLKFRDEESERHMFDLKDYFQTLLTYSG
ncbi:hypothetical protein SAMN04488029_3070 [Reichenbachiella faecimaris]|uniref:Uncharacterized protein n=1 Tax=Reichenbachiella faecimaris TaxID=692418 RepID=A0A1W2GJF8_REIFA|nr:hypothetical protein [Reichenbachiella faecimaris]SMD36787.1 hypothetical protein SAMN04488029_3070 [Reichenbachiella faecimaris]